MVHESGAPCCIKCGKPFEAPSGVGRPAAYCSVTCRRAAGYEITRCQRNLERLERERIELAGHHPIEMRDHRGRTLAQQREDVGRAIAELEARLAALLEANNS